MDSFIGNSAETPHGKEIQSAPDGKQIPAWGNFPGTGVVQSWVEEIREGIAARSSREQWQLIGPAAAIQHENPERAKGIFSLVATECGLKFIVAEAEGVLSLQLDSESWLKEQGKALVYLHPGDWMSEIDEEKMDGDDISRVLHFREALKECLEKIDPGCPVLFATAVADFDEMDDSWRSAGLFDRRFFIPPFPAEFVGNKFIAELGEELCAKSMASCPAKVGHLVAKEYDERTRSLSLLALKRLAAREKRKVEFIDLVNFAMRTTVEEDEIQLDSEDFRRRVAVHEAGHAVATMIGSAGNNIPDYATILSNSNFKGCVTESYEYHFSRGGYKTYDDFRQSIRIGLAGRAAEELFYGACHISTGDENDLEKCTEYATQAFARWGFSPDMETAGKSSANLAAIIGKGTSSEWGHIERLVRKFLDEEYLAVLNILGSHKSLLDQVANSLMNDILLSQQDLVIIYKEYSSVLLSSHI